MAAAASSSFWRKRFMSYGCGTRVTSRFRSILYFSSVANNSNSLPPNHTATRRPRRSAGPPVPAPLQPNSPTPPADAPRASAPRRGAPPHAPSSVGRDCGPRAEQVGVRIGGGNGGRPRGGGLAGHGECRIVLRPSQQLHVVVNEGVRLAALDGPRALRGGHDGDQERPRLELGDV